MAFIGEYQHAVDEKGRMALPIKFRKSLQGRMVITRGLDSSLYIYPSEEWEKLASRLSQLPINQANSRAFARHMLGGAIDAETDAQGRILIPEYLREHAGITARAVIVGLYNRLEIWSEEKWKEYRARTESNAEEIAEQLSGLN